MSSSRLYDYRVIAYSSSICPCKPKCEERNADCHSNCEKYKEYQRKMKIIKAENKRVRKHETTIEGYSISNAIKHTKSKKEKER